MKMLCVCVCVNVNGCMFLFWWIWNAKLNSGDGICEEVGGKMKGKIAIGMWISRFFVSQFFGFIVFLNPKLLSCIFWALSSKFYLKLLEYWCVWWIFTDIQHHQFYWFKFLQDLPKITRKYPINSSKKQIQSP